MDQVNARPGGRGRIVMLVDNGVKGDSRVQKTARSAAEAGWDVILLGIKGDGTTEETWRIGDAEVRLIPVNHALGTPRLQLRRSLRRPFAYPPGKTAAYRTQLAKGRQADARARLAMVAARRRAGRGRPWDAVTHLGLQATLATVQATSLWARFRARETTRLRQARQDPDAFLNKLPISFWRALRGPRSWRRLDPGLWDYELAFGPVIDLLSPDIVHANDFRMLGVGVRAIARAKARGRRARLLWDAHESVAGVMPRGSNPRWLPAQIDHVREYAPHPDAVISVSQTLAELLHRTHRLAEMPGVVLNAPAQDADPGSDQLTVPDLRALCGIGPDVPLLVYCGGVNPRRGISTMIDGLPHQPGVHIALVTLHPGGANAASEELLEYAATAGVADRVHLLPYVPHWQVAPFLATANAGIIPIHHQPNHELALITKFFEYSHARLPIVVSDVETMARTVRQTGQGEVFTAGDVAEYVSAVDKVLADPQAYRSAYDRPGLLEGWTWEAQAKVLDEIYQRLLDDAAGRRAPAVMAHAGR
jgi:glycogen(starch) synthase